MSENGDIYTTGKKFTLPPAVTAVTNLTSVTVTLKERNARKEEITGFTFQMVLSLQFLKKQVSALEEKTRKLSVYNKTM